ncbi:nitrite reductase [Stemphylium lycopersici]|uniref:Nitrate reductase n=1 Tax=Stemphylium lycopersici TaxID=183478 RepID=A0A364N7Z3_STELY|nr:nitrite reductase [Stemphylium lycopersici]RAR00237.1 nitrite reductase [Stemphylium lycopersici]RAR13400.1 nitrite reductase [Stemphylium lycopersici]
MSVVTQNPAGVPIPPAHEHQPQPHAASKSIQLPPSPPETVDGDDSNSTTSTSAEPDFPLPPPANTPPQVLDVDKPTPDAHVPRDPRLIRLTGVHPFNTEAPLTDLFNEGFLTSPELFYVRNHGAVPEVQDAECLDWEFSVEGLVANPLKITLRQLLEEYENVTYPVTLVCAGNRRKEQNMVRKSKGFSWGPAGVSTALFTGVVMKDIIERAKPLRKAKYVCMEGADKLPNGYYGTSVKLNWVMDPNRGIMLAHKMNGEALRPDHGKPLRAVIPGQIGGRSVKWLKKLIVTAEPSDNWYHIYDNRVLPTTVDPDEAAKNPKWWMDDRYAIYDLSPNSAIAYPAHEEKLALASSPESYNVRGYAYSGGGRRVTRCELSLDKGKTWQLAKIDYAEDKYRAFEDRQLYGARLDMDWRETSFCWCFWNLEIATKELEAADDIIVRVMDEAMCVQPRDMYWSVLGMMNNPWFRIVIHKENDTLRFEHPTQPALMPGGWMERVKKAGGNLSNGYWGEKINGEEPEHAAVEEVKEIKMTKDGVDKIIDIDELRKHDKAESPWFVVNGEVYDGTSFLEGHPGGAQSIISAAALDATDEFMAIHSETAKAMMPDYHIGTLDALSRKALAEGEPTAESTSPRPIFLDQRAWHKTLLHSKKTVSSDTRIFRFTLEHADQTLGLPTGQHLMLRLRDPVTREAIIRSYTPISETSERGFCDVLIKVYADTPDRLGGKMTKALDAIPVGHYVDFKGPVGKFEYLGKGLCAVNGREKKVDRFYMICGGSGITPIYQVLRAVIQDKQDSTRCTVLNGNRTEEDILCKEELDAFARDEGGRCTVLHSLTKAGEGWQGRRGRIGEKLLGEWCKKEEGKGCLVLICGPEALEKAAGEALREMGWREDEIMFF